jgi:sugar lactone lactonase YvrE
VRAASFIADIVIPRRAHLGEGPIWDDRNQVLAWVDIDEQTVFLFDPLTGSNRAFKMPTTVSAVVPRRSGGYVVALREDIAAVDAQTGALTILHRMDNPSAGLRYNDGKCDAVGRLWLGTMACDGSVGAGALYCCDAKRRHKRMVSSISCSNGMAWSLDQRTMYYIDTPTNQVDAFDYDASTGEISNRRLAATIPREVGYPDGMTIDGTGALWIAMWNGGVVLRVDPKRGAIIGEIEVPGAKQVTSCAFGGRGLDELYITTASAGLSDDELKMQPNAGFLFMAKPGVRGVPSFAYAG